MVKVLVIGSINLDLVVRARCFPVPGETVGGAEFATYPGGKGANQAVAASRLGAKVTLLGCVGGDAFGLELLNGVAAQGVDVSAVRVVSGASSGVATITVCDGENTIVVAPGANHRLCPADIDAEKALFSSADVILSQLEIPLECVVRVAELAASQGKPLILNPAPAVPLPEAILRHVALLTPNAHELMQLFPNQGTQADLLREQASRLLCTDGPQGVWFGEPDGTLYHQAAFPVEVSDTTGAGDTFNGALAAFWDFPRREAIRCATAAAALSVMQPGAQSGMPTYADLMAFIREHDARRATVVPIQKN